ncbi:WD40 repeat domain-containing protein [Gluconobacter sp. LMG 31484]|uniref:WD40 repeat domain-containing protein n=1 Tax=Gluconobacter vitians TaxID=2728102 RepID=A0ABR9Y408_9PROT|nr:WD40 repeat domain-containing protein [Gluconobacter vitians]MBF0858511.1 WD40 repeat domain-containing protein [Gluconobacter vitians]
MMGDLLTDRGGERRFESPVVHVVSARDGNSFAALTADGELVLIPRDRLRDPESWTVVAAHDGGLCLAQDCAPDAFLSGGEDGRLVQTFADGRSETLHEGRRWIDCVASTPDHLAFSTGKQIEVRTAEGRETLKVLEHPSTVTGIVFDAKGKRIAASHYNGASMWFVQAKVDTVRPFEWKGSHIAIAIHPGGEALVTSMQENDLHGWRLSDGHNMRMSGYPKQVKSLAFTRNGRWLATAGADAIILWPFFGGGPMGKAPAELARLPGLFVSAVCPNPKEDIIAAGYEDGTVVLAEIGSNDQRVLPLCSGQDTKRGKVTSLGFTPQGGSLVFGTEDGVLAAIDLSSAD